ncbi:IS200/IS605 family transposase [Halococcus sp. AFM35]|uniref:IS200/IS605 family transposase n=1 Tax=Halococcus sp. AFM35 TaxID=3421653 RepID=UPI003EBA58EC
MPRGYSKERTSVHNLHYHFIWCPKYRKAVLTDDVAERMDELVRTKADELGLEVIELAVQPDYIHLFITGNPKLAPNKIIQQLKGYTSHELRNEFGNMGLPSLWTRSYFVSSVKEIPNQIVEEYIEDQIGE